MSSTERKRVMVVDDHPIVRNGLKNALESSGRFEVVGQAEDGIEAVKLSKEVNPDVIVMDVIMPNKDGIDACREIMELLPDTRVLILTASSQEDAVIEAVAAGATGYLEKYSPPEELIKTVLEVAEGKVRIPQQALREVFGMVRDAREITERRASDALTATEREIMILFAGGMTYPQIGEATGKSRTTIRNILYRIQDKLGVKTKQELIIWVVRNGLVDHLVVGR